MCIRDSYYSALRRSCWVTRTRDRVSRRPPGAAAARLTGYQRPSEPANALLAEKLRAALGQERLHSFASVRSPEGAIKTLSLNAESLFERKAEAFVERPLGSTVRHGRTLCPRVGILERSVEHVVDHAIGDTESESLVCEHVPTAEDQFLRVA